MRQLSLREGVERPVEAVRRQDFEFGDVMRAKNLHFAAVAAFKLAQADLILQPRTPLLFHHPLVKREPRRATRLV